MTGQQRDHKHGISTIRVWQAKLWRPLVQLVREPAAPIDVLFPQSIYGFLGTLQPHEVYKYFIKILHECAVDLQVAPYSAWPQVRYRGLIQNLTFHAF